MSYDPTHPTDRDRARFALGDTAAAELLTDATYDAEIGARGYAGAVAALAQGLASRYAQRPGSVTLPNGISVSWADRVKTWQALATTMRAEAAQAAQAARAAAVTTAAPNRSAW